MPAKRMIAVLIAALGIAGSGAYAATEANTDPSTYLEIGESLSGVQIAKRGRGKDDARADDRRGRGDKADRGGKRDRDDNRGGSGRKKPRVPGGSGCDDPEDILEHPACSA